MKVSLNWIKQYIDFELPPIDELVEKIGARLGAVEAVVDLGARYQGVVIAKVVDCEKLENSDHLNLCLIDDGGITPAVNRDAKGHVQVVCGAPNVRAGLWVAWLPPGTTVPSSVGTPDPFVLEARELRGVVSNGMLASPKELALGDSHDGIMELDPNGAEAGADFAVTYQLDDYVIDIENKMFTHRPDCFGQLGVAREIAGILGHPFVSPKWYLGGQPELFDNATDHLKLEVRNELPELVPRFTAVAMSGVSGGAASPAWLQTYLQRVGVRPISLIVDVTNYMMLLTGQPLHAYDYDKVKALDDSDRATLVVRNPHADEKITLLNGKVVEPRPEAIVIASATRAIGLGGVMGGADTEVDETTKNIILECATFDMYSIRKTSMAHGIFSDAVTRFNKGQSPLQNDRVLAETARMVGQLSNDQARPDSRLVDDNHLSSDSIARGCISTPVTVGVKFINDRLGLQLSAQEMKTLLENVECEVELLPIAGTVPAPKSPDSPRATPKPIDDPAEELVITAPFWRTDIELREDIVEEIGRLYGFDALRLELPRRDLTPASKDALLELKATIRDHLARAGANEVLTYSFTPGNLIEKAGQDTATAFKLSNALSPELQYYRLSLIPSLLDKVHPNIKAGYDQFVLFEMGKGHNTKHLDDFGLPVEFEMLEAVIIAQDKVAPAGSAYYQAREYVTYLTRALGLRVTFTAIHGPVDFPILKPFDQSRTALVKIKGTDILLGGVGEFNASVRKNFKLPAYSAGFGLSLTDLWQAVQAHSGQQYRPLPRFPKVEQDMCLKVPATLAYQELYDFVEAELLKVQPKNVLVELTPVDIYQRQDDTAHKQITVRLSIASYDQTLTDSAVHAMLEAAATAAKATYAAERI